MHLTPREMWCFDCSYPQTCIGCILSPHASCRSFDLHCQSLLTSDTRYRRNFCSPCQDSTQCGSPAFSFMAKKTRVAFHAYTVPCKSDTTRDNGPLPFIARRKEGSVDSGAFMLGVMTTYIRLTHAACGQDRGDSE